LFWVILRDVARQHAGINMKFLTLWQGSSAAP
jgi:hypothetical protein